jgi:hypothetical protein
MLWFAFWETGMEPSYLKRFTRDEFNRSAIGREIASCRGLFNFATERHRGHFDHLKPYLLHSIAPEPPDRQASHFLLYGYKYFSGDVVFGLSLGNGRFSKKTQLNVPYGNEKDRIDIQFRITARDPDHVWMTHVNKFGCAEAAPKNAEQAQEALNEAEGYIRLIKNRHLVDFQREKTIAWREAGADMAKFSADTIMTCPPASKGRPRRFVGFGDFPDERVYIDVLQP